MHIVFLFYEGMTALDAIGPSEVLSHLPGVRVSYAAQKAGPILTDSGLILMASHSLTEITNADILVVPGAGNATTLRQYPKTLEWLRLIHNTTTWTTSVCTGSLILGAAGILSNLQATTHWTTFDRLSHFKAIPVRGRVVEDGKVITAAGVSAGIDMALILTEKIGGPLLAQTMQLALEYDPKPPYDSGSPEKADPTLSKALKDRMTAKFEKL